MKVQEKEKIQDTEIKNIKKIEETKEIKTDENHDSSQPKTSNLNKHELDTTQSPQTKPPENNTKEKTIFKIPQLVFIIIGLIILGCICYISYKIYHFYNPHTPDPIPITSIVISLPAQEIEVNNPVKIETIIEPTNYNISNLQWFSSNPEIITIENGIITAITPGQSSIYVINDNGVKSNELIINSIIKIKEIILSKENIEIEINNSETLLATISPENATNKDLIWKSSDENIASVDENGVITGNNIGECTISVTNNDETIASSCHVRIKPIEVNSLHLDETQVTLGVGQEYLLVGSIYPNNATYKNLTWSSSNNNIISVNNGKIKAIAEGNATVTITSRNGKTASCTFTVQSNVSSGTIRYAKDTYYVRSGQSRNYSTLATVYKNDIVEILKISGDWTKVRTSSGIVGYMLSNGYSSSKSYYISNVPYINQFSLGYPTGCEAVSATMVANYFGYNVSSSQVIAATPTDEKGIRQETHTIEVTTEQLNEETGETETITTTEEQTDWYGGNPFEVFVGHPSKKLNQGSYGCYAKPITIALQACGIPASNISGCSIDTVFEYIKNGKPVIVWCKKNAGDLIEGVTWKYEDGSGSYTELKGEHCAVLIGYDSDYVYLNDPSAGKGVKQPKAKFISNWHILFNQAIVIN